MKNLKILSARNNSGLNKMVELDNSDSLIQPTACGQGRIRE
jgi:hypothetical protein